MTDGEIRVIEHRIVTTYCVYGCTEPCSLRRHHSHLPFPKVEIVHVLNDAQTLEPPPKIDPQAPTGEEGRIMADTEHTVETETTTTEPAKIVVEPEETTTTTETETEDGE